MTAHGPTRPTSGPSRRDGFVLIAVLWILAALAGLVGAYVAYVLTMAQSADVYLRRIGAEAAVSGALELAVYDLLRMDANQRADEGVLDYRIGDLRAQVRYASEGLRINLNKASLETLTTLFADQGGARGGADRYAQRIVGWREKPDGAGAAMEDLSYRAARVNYMPRHGQFQSVEELWDVLDIPPEVIARILPFVTVYGGADKPGVGQNAPDGQANAAGAEPGSPPQPAGPDNAQQGGGGGQGGGQALKPTRFDIRVIDPQGRVSAAEAVVIGTRDSYAPYNVLLWRIGDDIAAPRDGRRR